VVDRAAPLQPVGRIGVEEHFVGDGPVLALPCGNLGRDRGRYGGSRGFGRGGGSRSFGRGGGLCSLGCVGWFCRRFFGGRLFARRCGGGCSARGLDRARIELSQDLFVGRQFLGADGIAALVEQIVRDIGILLRRQGAGRVGRHGRGDEAVEERGVGIAGDRPDYILAVAGGTLRGIGGLAASDLFLGRIILRKGGSSRQRCECEGCAREKQAGDSASGSLPVFRG